VCDNTVSNDPDAGQAKRQPRNVSAVTGQEDKEDYAALHKRVGELQEALELVTKGILALVAGAYKLLCRMLQQLPAQLKVLTPGSLLPGEEPDLVDLGEVGLVVGV